jgi:hypothetical protein
MADSAPYPDEVTLGDPTSPVGLCTLWSRQERILRAVPRELYAACGNLYSLWGINVLIRSVLARPTLRYLVLCGIDYAGTGAALLALAEQGPGPDGALTGTDARLDPDLDAATVARFRQQITLVDLRGCTDGARVAERIRELVGSVGPTPPFPMGEGRGDDRGEGAPASRQEVGNRPWPSTPPSRRAKAGRVARSSWSPDPGGNFLIALEDAQLVATHATTTGGPTGQRFVGRTAAEVYRAILAAGLVSQLDHAAYLGAELARAEVALRAALPYRQDEPLALAPRQPGSHRGAGEDGAG